MRMKNPALIVPDAMQNLLALGAAAKNGVPSRTLKLVYLRASQSRPVPNSPRHLEK